MENTSSKKIKILETKSKEDLEKLIEEYLKKGYEMIGSVSMSCTTHKTSAGSNIYTTYYIQTMIIEEPINSPKTKQTIGFKDLENSQTYIDCPTKEIAEKLIEVMKKELPICNWRIMDGVFIIKEKEDNIQIYPVTNCKDLETFSTPHCHLDYDLFAKLFLLVTTKAK